MATVDQSLGHSVRTIPGIILLWLLSAAFFVSAVGKLPEFSSFTARILEIVPYATLAEWVAKCIIAIELMIGICLLTRFRLQTFTYPLVAVSLLVFTGYLMYVIAQHGDSGDCGCLGAVQALKPSAGILKNLILLGITALLWHIYPYSAREKWRVVTLSGCALALFFPFVWVYVAQSKAPEIIHQKLDLQSLHGPQEPSMVVLNKGKHLIAFLSVGCPHCRKTAFILQSQYRQDQSLPYYMVLLSYGDTLQNQEFFEETRAEIVPHVLFRDIDRFIEMSGGAVPTIFWVSEGMALKKLKDYHLKPNQIKLWLEE